MNNIYSNGAVETGSTSDEEQPAAATDLIHVLLQTSEHDLIGVKVDPSSHGVHHRLGLLEDFFLHVRLEVTCTKVEDKLTLKWQNNYTVLL